MTSATMFPFRVRSVRGLRQIQILPELHGPGREFDYQGPVVRRRRIVERGAVAPGHPALPAAADDHPALLAALQDTDRYQQAAAVTRLVARVHVQVQRMQAGVTVVAKAAAD